MLANPQAGYVLLRRSQVIRQMRDFLNRGGFVEVQTPILSTRAGGAIARPFETSASEFSEKQLSLRVAPELWLKRLIVGGMDRIFEIGPCFRNEGEAISNTALMPTDALEGLDKLHNPEFTSCEFYSAYSSIQDLIRLTESMLRTIVRNIQSAALRNKDDPNRLPRSTMPPIALRARFFKGPYPQLDFIPALNKALGLKLPNLDAESAAHELISIFQENEVALPAHPTLPRLLDKLSATYLEPQCDEPTWIVNYPECLSPLSKSFLHPSPDIAQPVAARAELFVRGREIVNCYEEENSPFEQRRKFMMQQEYANTSDGRTPDSETMEVDEAYLKALEWGLPPTGGWGCGIDRLVMLLTEKHRINDVLTFGNLRSVTRTPESREMVRRPMWPTTLSNGEGVSDARNERRADDLQAEETVKPQIDAAEEAIMKIKEKLKKGKSSRSKLGKKVRQNLSAEQEGLSKWLSEAGPPDGAKDRDGAGGLDAGEPPPKE